MKAGFGDFEFDTATGELRRGGEIVRLQSQPAQVLAMLVERAGDVVTRDALRDAIWGADTFVDFDKGLNFAVGQVRAALGDSADAPAFIRTLPKRGYQFIAPVTPLGAQAPASAPARRRNRRPWVAAAALLLTVAGAAAWILRPQANRRFSDAAQTIAVLPFDNETGAADFDRYATNLTDSVVAELTVAGRDRFDVIGNASVLRAPRSKRDLTAIAGSLNARYVVMGQVQRDVDHVRVLAHLIRLPEQTHLWVTRFDRPVGGALVPAADAAKRISTEFLGKL